ncbi:hypothetical protein M408DRAFT_104411 [Serendipita vermifera MAFF 305830]|uniref:Uncharacterized protein n=1 Tax=Serendipita vermifera MAFF 305830 TaxID=933852 RepID=A0A0C3AQ58_SERVB|nr:hypothetical protein M408DRAFT_104411 [Serendipita vermifera MAFF 305830]
MFPFCYDYPHKESPRHDRSSIHLRTSLILRIPPYLIGFASKKRAWSFDIELLVIFDGQNSFV